MNIRTIEPGDMTKYFVGVELLSKTQAEVFGYTNKCALVVFGTETELRAFPHPIDTYICFDDVFGNSIPFKNDHTCMVCYLAMAHILLCDYDETEETKATDFRLRKNWRDDLPTCIFSRFENDPDEPLPGWVSDFVNKKM